MPKLGLTMTEGTIEEWKVKEGEAVKEGQVLFSVATDKLTNDIEAEADGTLLKILCREGETMACKEIIAWIGEEGEEVPDAPAAAAEEAPAEEAPAEAPKAAPAAAKAAAPVNREAGAYVLATPYAKKLAKEKGYDLAKIPATGPNGRIVAKDVLEFVAGPKMSPVAARMAADLDVDVSEMGKDGKRVMKADILAAAGLVPAGAESAAAIAAEDFTDNVLEVKKVAPLRRSIAKNMAASWETSPRVTYTRPVDATTMMEMRSALKEKLAEQGIKLTFNHILMKVCARVLMEMPEVNASFADDMLTLHKHANVGLAVAKGDGLIVPNVKGCEMKSLAQVAAETEELIDKTRSGAIGMEDLTGGTFTISSLGPYGITSFSPIINQPELAILGVCDIVKTPVVGENDEIVIKPMMNLSLTADHRVIDGVMASKFLQRVDELLENPYLLMV